MRALSAAAVARMIVAVVLTMQPHSSIRAETTRKNAAIPVTDRGPSELWVPADIDASIPTVNPLQPCSLNAVLDGVGQRVQELATNLDRFSAKEIVQHQNVDRKGKLGNVERRKFDYVVHLAPGFDGYMSMSELRKPSTVEFPDGTATNGTSSLMLIFLPTYSKDFEMRCEGLGSWKGHPAWQVRFEQRDDRSVHTSALVINNRLFPVHLRGRAWILADSYEIARLETDLAHTIPEIGMRIEHIDIDYGPIFFPARATELWLPLDAELYLDFKNHRFYRRHQFIDFTLFSVDVDQRFNLTEALPAN